MKTPVLRFFENSLTYICSNWFLFNCTSVCLTVCITLCFYCFFSDILASKKQRRLFALTCDIVWWMNVLQRYLQYICTYRPHRNGDRYTSITDDSPFCRRFDVSLLDIWAFRHSGFSPFGLFNGSPTWHSGPQVSKKIDNLLLSAWGLARLL